MNPKKLFISIFIFIFAFGTTNIYQFNACDTVAACDDELAQLAEDIKNTEEKNC